MTDFGYWQALAAGSDRFMCMICFGGFPLDEAHQDIIGQPWDICQECAEEEKEALARKAAGAEDRPEPQRVTEVTPVPEYLSGAKLFAPLVAPALEGPRWTRAAHRPPLPSQPLPLTPSPSSTT